MGKRAVIKAKANKKSRSAQTASSRSLSGGSFAHRHLPTGHIRKAKHHKAQQAHHDEQARSLSIHTDKGKVKRRRAAPAFAAEHERAAAKHEKAKIAHVKAAKSRKKK